MIRYHVRIGRSNNPSVHVRTPSGKIISYRYRLGDKAKAKQLAAKVRQHVNADGKLDKRYWTLTRRRS